VTINKNRAKNTAGRMNTFHDVCCDRTIAGVEISVGLLGTAITLSVVPGA